MVPLRAELLSTFFGFPINFPSNIIEGPIKDPSYFSSAFGSGIVKSPIEFFITSVLLLCICLEIFKYIIYYAKSENKSTINKKIILFLIYLVFVILELIPKAIIFFPHQSQGS